MKLLTIYRKNVYITYKQNLCSFPAFAIIIFTIFTISVPFFIVYTINRTIWGTDLIIFEKPNLNFQYKYLVLADYGDSIMRCSSFERLNELTDGVEDCDEITYSEDDFDHDSKLDQMKWKIQFESSTNMSLRGFELFFLFDADLKVCSDTIKNNIAELIFYLFSVTM